MGIAAEIAEDWHAALAALAWHVEAGVDEVLLDAPVNRYALAPEAPRAVSAPASGFAAVAALPQPPASLPAATDAVQAARHAAEAAASLPELQAAMTAFDLCEMKLGARATVFADGQPGARVMLIGEAPGRDEDAEGRPFVGRAGHLLDRMFAAIGLSRQNPDSAHGLYITNVMPWRPPQNRDPTPQEIAMMLPFLVRHVELAAPDLIVVMGNTPCAAVLGQRGIIRLRGVWHQALGRPVLPMVHPAYLLRTPVAKREAWADLLALQARLRAMAGATETQM